LTVDSLLQAADNALRALFAPAQATRSPDGMPEAPVLQEADRRHVAGLMRVNHAGEIAAQALYHGQALLAHGEKTREFLLRAAAEEGDHLAWCEQRLGELGARPSLLNPLWYAGSFAIGAAAAALSDSLSLGFVAETERQVEGHIAEHLDRSRKAICAAGASSKPCRPMRSDMRTRPRKPARATCPRRCVQRCD
jgi:ubiquinone biosynthesis monooxygenase Coq7